MITVAEHAEADSIIPNHVTQVIALFNRHLHTAAEPAFYIAAEPRSDRDPILTERPRKTNQLCHEYNATGMELVSELFIRLENWIHQSAHIPSVEDYVRNHYPTKRADQLMESAQNAVDRTRISNAYTTMWKSGEAFPEGEAKERNIMVPPDEVVALHGWLNHCLLCATEGYEEFAFHSHSTNVLEMLIGGRMGADDVFISLDGS